MRSGFTDDDNDGYYYETSGMKQPYPSLSGRHCVTEDIEARSHDDDDDDNNKNNFERNRRHKQLMQQGKHLNHDDDDDEFSLPSSYSEIFRVARNLSSMPSPLLSPPKRCSSPPNPSAASNNQSNDHRETSPISAPTIPVIDRSVAGRDDDRMAIATHRFNTKGSGDNKHPWRKHKK